MSLMTHETSCPPQRRPPNPLRLRRLTLGLTQADLARLAGVSREQVQRLDTGRCVPTWPTAHAVAVALDCEPGALFPNERSPGGNQGSATTAAQGRHAAG